MTKDVILEWNGPNAGAIINRTGQELRAVRILVAGESKVRGRKHWHEDRDSLPNGASITFSRLERRGPEPLLRVRFKLGLGPTYPWHHKDFPLILPASVELPTADPWSLGARTQTS